MIYRFRVHEEEKGFWAECIELPGCLTQGETMTELQENMKDALELYLSEPSQNQSDTHEIRVVHAKKKK